MSFLVKHMLNPFADTAYFTAIISKKRKTPKACTTTDLGGKRR